MVANNHINYIVKWLHSQRDYVVKICIIAYVVISLHSARDRVDITKLSFLCNDNVLYSDIGDLALTM